MKKVTIFLTLFATIPLFAQPIFTENDLPKIGYEAKFVSDTTDTIIVNLGNSGGPQTWDFSRKILGDTNTLKVIKPEGTPVVDSFPDAKVVYYMTGALFDTIQGKQWQYYNPTSSKMNLLGDYTNIGDTMLIYHDYDPDRVNSVFPLKMGASWDNAYETNDTLDKNGLIISERTTVAHSKVDAWGEVIVPAGRFKALRIVTYDTTIAKMTFLVPLTPDTIEKIKYQWIAADLGPVMLIESKDGETNPSFDTASLYMALVKNNGIQENYAPILTSMLKVKDSRVFLNLAHSEYVRLEIFDVSGNKTAVLHNSALSAGEHSLKIPKLIPGVYFVKMTTPTCSRAAKFIVLN